MLIDGTWNSWFDTLITLYFGHINKKSLNILINSESKYKDENKTPEKQKSNNFLTDSIYLSILF